MFSSCKLQIFQFESHDIRGLRWFSVCYMTSFFIVLTFDVAFFTIYNELTDNLWRYMLSRLKKYRLVKDVNIENFAETWFEY